VAAAVVLLIVGAVVLIAGAESAVRGTARLSIAAGISAFALGALLFGIDLEGLSASLLAAARGQTQIAAGQAFGTIVFLFGVGLALALFVARGPIPSPSAMMVIAPAVPLAAAALAISDQVITRLEGALLVALYGGYVWLTVVMEGRSVRQRGAELEHEAEEVKGSVRRAALIAGVGLVAVFGGAWLLVDGAVRLLDTTTLTAGFIGAAIVGTLAGLDEILLEALPVMRGTPALATGNLFGTVAAFTSAVVGLAALIRPLTVDAASELAFLGGATMYAFVSVVFLLRGRLARPYGVLLLAAYLAWLAYASTL
jgi:cation:H+ antiporter